MRQFSRFLLSPVVRVFVALTPAFLFASPGLLAMTANAETLAAPEMTAPYAVFPLQAGFDLWASASGEILMGAALVLSTALLIALYHVYRLREAYAGLLESRGRTSHLAAQDVRKLPDQADLANRFSGNLAPRGDDVEQHREVEVCLRKALTTGAGLQLAYQQLYSTTGEITGAEALLRWKQPGRYALTPQSLIAVAEKSGLIAEIGDWVLHEACRMAKFVPIAWIAINVSPVQLRDAGFARRCLDIVHSHRIPPQRIQIEITEGIAIEDPAMAGATLDALRSAGVRVALDDFGTGYSSLNYLRTYPVDRLKIDRSFVDGLAKGQEGEAIVAAIIELGRALRLDVIAEGVETPQQRDLLVRMGCQELQGYLFSRPIMSASFAANFSSICAPRGLFL